MLESPLCKGNEPALQYTKQEVGMMTCKKCKGLMVKEWRPEYAQDGAVLRCINCGLILDPLIAQNRAILLHAKQRVLNAA